MRQRTHLLILAAAAALPFILLAVAIAGTFDAHRRDELERMLLGHAHMAVTLVDADLARNVAVLDTLAALVESDPPREHLREVLEAALRRRPDWRDITLYGNGSPPAPLLNVGAATLVPVEQAAAALETGKAVLGPVRLGAPHGEPVTDLLVPIRRDGRVDRLLAATMSTRRFDDLLEAHRIPPGWVLALLDQSRTIASRSPAVAQYVGTLATPSLTAELDRGVGTETFFFARSKDGDKLYTAVSRSAVSGWTVVVGAPATVVEEPIRRLMLALLAGGTGAVILAASLAGYAMRTLSRREEADDRLLALETRELAERQLTGLAANLPGIIYRRVLHPDGRVEYPYVAGGAGSLGHLAAAVSGHPQTIEELARAIIPANDIETWENSLRRSAETLEPFAFEGRIRTATDDPAWIKSLASAHREPDGSVVWDGVVLDITDLKHAQTDLQAALAEKETLLREIHHRVKNNLQVVSSLIQMQALQLRDPAAAAGLAELDRRIGVLARLHEQLYRSDDLGRVDFGAFLRQLADSLTSLHGRRIAVAVEAETLACDIDTAIPLGVLANELASNAFKHAFPGDRAGRVTITLSSNAEAVLLEVADDGIGMAADAHTRGGTLGLDLVNALVSQVKGKLSWTTSGRGTRVAVLLPPERFS